MKSEQTAVHAMQCIGKFDEVEHGAIRQSEERKFEIFEFDLINTHCIIFAANEAFMISRIQKEFIFGYKISDIKR